MKQVFLHRMGALLLALILTLSLALPTMATSAPGTSPDQTENTEGDGNTDGSGEDDKDDGDDGSGDGNEDNDNKPVAVEGVDISLRAAAIDIGESTEPIIDFSPSFATNQEYTLTSSDTSVATITEGNKITGVSPGEAAITVTTADGAKTATTKIEVSGFILKANDNILAKSGGDGKGELAMELGRSQTLVCTTYGKAKDYVEFIWQSEDRMVVYAIGTGTTCQITARSVGSTAVILTAGGKEAKFTVKVSDSSALEGGTITAGTPYKPSTMLAEIRKNCPDTLSYISNLSVSPNQGVLYYGYKTPADTGFGVGNEKYYITKTTGQRNFSDVTFVPRAEFSGTATITYMAFNTRGESVGGSIRLTIKAIDDVSYTTLKDTPLVFQGGDFNTICRVRTGHELSYVTFTLPAASQGVLYYNYTGEAAYAEKVIDGTQYFRSRSPYLDSITFLPASGFTGSVRIDYRAVDTSGLAYNGRATINVGTGNGSTTSPEEGDVNYRAAAGDPVDFRASDFNDACWEALDGTLDYIKFTEISSDQGELRYNYRSSANPGSQVSESTRYYRNDSPSISNITFVPSSDHTEAVTLKFTGYGVGGERFEGTVVIDYTGKAGGGNISYTVRAGRPAEFETADFNELCQNKLGNSLDYVCFDDLPSSSRGTLYRNYTSSGSGTRVDEDDRISRTNLSRVAFVPNRSYSGTVDIGFTGYDTKGNSFSGTVTIQVDDSGASEGISYSTRPGGSVLFNASDFNDMCREVTGASLNYVRFELPASSRGTLYYKYDSDKPAEVKESTSYYRSGSGRLLDDITFVSNSNFAGTVEISYTGYSSGSGQFSGSVLITVAAPRAETIYLTAGSAPIQLSSAAFRQACGTVLTQGLSYVRFTSLPDTRAGRLYENYMDAASGYQASTGSPRSEEHTSELQSP